MYDKLCVENDRYEMKVPALTFGAAGFERNDCDDVYLSFSTNM